LNPSGVAKSSTGLNWLQ